MKILLCMLALLQISAVVTEQGNLRLYWSQLRFSYSSMHQSASYSEAQQQAWETGLAGFASAVKKVYRQQRLATTHVPTAVSNASRHLFLQKTIFFADFKAQHQVSGSMVRLFPVALIPSNLGDDKVSATQPTANTGLIIKVAASFAPQVLYEVRDAEGNLLFDVSHVRKKAFKSNLMGRYFSANDSRIRVQVGNKPYTLQASSPQPGHLQVDAKAWDKFIRNNQTLLTNSRIAIVLVE